MNNQNRERGQTNLQPNYTGRPNVQSQARYSQNYPEAPGSRGEPKQPQPSLIIIAVQLLLLILSTVAAVIFISFIPLDVNYDFVVTNRAVNGIADIEAVPSGGASESDIPKPPDFVAPDYDFSAPVPESSVYPLEHFETTVFIGDSRTAGLIQYTKFTPINYSSVGLNIGQLGNKAFIKKAGENGETTMLTCMEALEADKGTYSAVYIALGINELGWDVNSFVKTYRKALQEVRSIIDVPLYIQLIIPVTTESSEKSTFGITNEKASQFNEKLRALAKEQQVFLIDPTELFALEDGTLDPEDSFDGVHLNAAAYRELASFYQCHVVDPRNYANLPFGSDTEQ